jgi:glycosyltransferase involved in cell wall biosynthesis
MPDKVNIMHLRATNFFGGPEKQILEHFSRMDSSRFRMVLTTFREGEKECSLFEHGRQIQLHCRIIQERNPFDLRMVKDLAALIREEKIQLLCTHGYKPDIVGRIACWIAGIPMVVISRGWTAENKKICVYETLDRLSMRWADHIVAVSEGQREKILKCGISKDKVSVIYNGIDVGTQSQVVKTSFRQETGLDAEDILIASGGRLSPEKNFAGFISAAAQVAKMIPRAYFAVFGEGILRQALEKEIAESDLEGKFLLPGFRSDFRDLLAEVDIFVLPSFSEGLPNVILEAFARRKPVVATAVGGTPEVVQDEVSGFLVEPHETEKLAKRLVQLCRDSSLRQRMGEAGYKGAKARFNYETQILRYEDLYLKMVGSKESQIQAAESKKATEG